MSLHDLEVETLSGERTTLGALTAGKAALVVNVASRCGLTPQYTGLEQLHEELGPRGFTVVGVPCNQFKGQEPGTAEEIAEFCSATYGVTFPMSEKVEVNGDGRHPVYARLVTAPDTEGEAGDVQWNFEKFLVDGDGNVWVAGFHDPAITLLCGAASRTCPGDRRIGDPISPAKHGYSTKGLQHVTAVQVDPSGNVWAANNWTTGSPLSQFVGGNGLVEFIGAAPPVAAPLIGPPQRP